jgi:hypothetical protein
MGDKAGGVFTLIGQRLITGTPYCASKLTIVTFSHHILQDMTQQMENLTTLLAKLDFVCITHHA